jgi:hypothetical protein
VETLERILGGVLHVLVQLPAVFLLAGLIAGRIDGEPLDLLSVVISFGGCVALGWMHVTAITRPRAHQFRNRITTVSTSRAHSVADVLLMIFGVELVRIALLDPTSPAYPILLGWGIAHLVISGSLLTLRVLWPAR